MVQPIIGKFSVQGLVGLGLDFVELGGLVWWVGWVGRWAWVRWVGLGASLDLEFGVKCFLRCFLRGGF